MDIFKNMSYDMRGMYVREREDGVVDEIDKTRQLLAAKRHEREN